MHIAVLFAIAYLAGSVPFGLLLGRLSGKDIRQYGSGNIGATNVWRVCGWRWGLAAFVLDFAKGLAPVLLAGADVWPGIAAAVGAVLGHTFPVWLRFRGGKGVATSAGAVAGLMGGAFGIAIAVFIITVAVSHYISLGSMTASVALAAAAYCLLPDALGADLPLFVLSLVLMALIIVRHRGNISRILAGTENRFPPPKK